MALTKQVETPHGIILTEAYIKIIEQSGSKVNINIRVAAFKDRDASNSNKEFAFQSVYSFIPTLEDNFIKQGYDFLKTLPEYSDAKDC